MVSDTTLPKSVVQSRGGAASAREWHISSPRERFDVQFLL